MRFRTIFCAVLCAVVFSFASFSQSDSEQKGIRFSVVLEGAFYPSSERLHSAEPHFSMLDGFYNRVEGRALFSAAYKIPIVLGSHWLLKDSSVTVLAGAELTPLTIAPFIRADFSPLPFLVFSAGASGGSGWAISSLYGIAALDEESRTYEPFTAFSAWYYDVWASALFQFDLGAIVKGDWTHVLFLAGYKVIYKGVSSVSWHDVWKWQNSGNKVNGLQYEASVIIGYQLPFAVHRIGVITDLFGNYDSDDYGKFGDSYKGDFVTVKISPFVQVVVSKKDEISIAAQVANRRAFDEEYPGVNEEVFLHFASYEWFFNRIGARWTHIF